MASRTKRTTTPTQPALAELQAGPDRCAEASTLSRDRYIPCNAPAKYVVGWKGRSEAPIRMCEMCADHNVNNRGGFIAQPYIPTNPPAPEPLPLGHNVTDDALIAENHALEDKLKLGLSKFNEWKKPIADRTKAIEDDLFKRLVKRGADKTSTDSGTAYISRLEDVKIEDKAKLFDFIAEQWETVGDEVSLKIGIKAVRAWMEEHDGELPPGISLNKYSRLNINRS